MIDRRQFLLASGGLVLPWSCRRKLRAVESLCVSRVRRGPPTRMAPHATPAPAIPGKQPLHPDALARFVDALPIPPVRMQDGVRPDPESTGKELPYHRVSMRPADVRIHRDLPPTRMWSYDGTVPGPTFEVRAGHPVLVEWANELPSTHFLPIDHNLCGADAAQPEVRTVVHVHGARVPPDSDGYPEDWYTPGLSVTYRYPNAQEAATLWYHDHAMGIERLNQYAGLFGVYLVRDEVEDALHLPSGPREIPLVLCDRLFDAQAQLHYPTSGNDDAPWIEQLNGDAILANGKLFPYLDVEPTTVRFRLVNAANSTPFDLSLSNGRPFHQIGSDQGLLPAPVSVGHVVLAPAERADVIVDFGPAAGETFTLNHRFKEILQFRVKPGRRAPAPPAPARLRPVAAIPAAAAKTTRTLTLNEYKDPKTNAMLMLLDAKRWHEPVTERPALGSVEIWRLVNLTEDSHPIHLHLVRFQILDRQQFDADEYLTSGQMQLFGSPVPPPPEEAGWKDTVRADPGLITRIIVRFDSYAGRYLWHCHVLEHAANEMMRPFEIVRA